jgi:hypothetical protein
MALDARAPAWWLDIGKESLLNHLTRASIAGVIALPLSLLTLWVWSRFADE